MEDYGYQKQEFDEDGELVNADDADEDDFEDDLADDSFDGEDDEF